MNWKDDPHKKLKNKLLNVLIKGFTKDEALTISLERAVNGINLLIDYIVISEGKCKCYNPFGQVRIVSCNCNVKQLDKDADEPMLSR